MGEKYSFYQLLLLRMDLKIRVYFKQFMNLICSPLVYFKLKKKMHLQISYLFE